MKATIELIGEDILCRSKNCSPGESRLAGDQALPLLTAWAARYDAAVRKEDETGLQNIGRDIFTWLDKDNWASSWAMASGSRSLEVRIVDSASPLAKAMLDAPWELLVHKEQYLAGDPVQLFEVTRRIGRQGEPTEPRHSDLQLMFMAAAPKGQTVLDFENEEAAILKATERLPLHLMVEESGTTEFPGKRLDFDGPFEALHLSCHGDIHPQRGHVLAQENEFGELAHADAGDIDEYLALRALGVAEGNPGLQAVLMTPIFKGESKAAAQALASIEHFRRTGAPPEEIRQLIAEGAAKDEANAIATFFKRMAFDTYRQALPQDQATMLQAATLFSSGLPIPKTALLTAGAAAGAAEPQESLQRLLDLGLADDWGEIGQTSHVGANPLAQPLAGDLSQQASARLAALIKAWEDGNGDLPWDFRAMEVLRLTLSISTPQAALLNQAGKAAARYLFDRKHDARQAFDRVVQPVLAKLKSIKGAATPGFFLIAADCASRLG